jgi:acyl-CoA synthetase (AMP-forming)/AMP-acid ligase II
VVLGRPVSGVAVRIVGADGRSVPDGTIGEIVLAGASVGRISGETPTAAGGIATGDLGFVHDGELVVTGRRKELMILRGANVYPADAEAAASAADPSLNPGGVAAFGTERDGTEEMMVVFEVQRGPLPSEVFDGLARRINEAVGKATGHVPAAVMAVPYGALPRTTSGKIRRHALAGLCRRGAIAVLNATDARLIVPEEATS